MKQVLSYFLASTPHTTSTTRLTILGGSPGGTSFDTQGDSVWPCSGVFRNLIVRVGTAPGVGKSYVFTLRKDGVALAMTCTISGTDVEARYTASDIAVTAGEIFDLRIVPSGTPVSPGSLSFSVEFEGSTAGESGYSGHIGSASSSTSHTGVWRMPLVSTTAADVRTVTAAEGVITALYIACRSLTAARTAVLTAGNGLTAYIYKNGVKQDGTGGTVDTLTQLSGGNAANATFSLPVVAGDLLSIEVSRLGDIGNFAFSLGVRFVATIDGQSQFAIARASTLVNSDTMYHWPTSLVTTSWQAVETVAQILGGVTSFDLRDWTVALVSAPGSGKSYVFTARLNSASPTGGPAVTISDLATSGADSSGVLTVADGDLVAIKTVPSGTPTTSRPYWCFIQGPAAVVNDPPVVDAGPDQVGIAIGEAVQMDASATDDGIPDPPAALTYLWTKQSGPGTATFSDDTELNPTVSFDANGVYVLRLTVSDSDLSAFDELTVTVGPNTFTGATPVEGTNPAPGDPAANIHFAHITIGETSYFASEVLIRDDRDHFGGKKAATLTYVSPIERRLSRTGYPSCTFTIRVADVTRHWRGLMRTHTLESIRVEIFRCAAPHGRIVGDPFRLAAGVVKPGGFTADDGYSFEFQCVDLLGDHFANPLNQPKVPTWKLTKAAFPAMDPTYDGKVASRVFGSCEEADVGVVPMVLLAEAVNLQDVFGAGAMSVEMDAYLLCEGAVDDITAGYYNLPTYGSEAAGARLERFVIPPDAYTDNILTHPHASNWTTMTGETNQFVDYLGRRLTPVFVDHAHAYAEPLREGRITVLFDVLGATDRADAGLPYASFEEIVTRLLLDYVFLPTDFTTLTAAVPNFESLTGAYSIIDVTSLYASKTIADAQSLVPGFVIGAEGRQQGLWQLLGEIFTGGALDIGQNRHGQLIFSRRNPSATPTVTFRAQRHLVSGSYQTDRDGRATTIEYRYGVRYSNPWALATPTAGEPLPVFATEWQWASGVVELKNQDAIDALWDTSVARLPPIELDNKVTRDATTAAAVAQQALDYGTGAGPSYHGTLLFEIEGPWELLTKLDSNGKTRELGDVIAIEDDEAPDYSVGDTALRGRVTRIRIDPERDRVTLAGEILELPAA